MQGKIYTKKGDKGETSLIGGKKVTKFDIRVEAYGTVDELKSYLAIIKDTEDNPALTKIISHIQERLFRVESQLACNEMLISKKLPSLTQRDVQFLEKKIDHMEAMLPPLKNFIIPGGQLASSHCHVARCICRRAERIIVNLNSQEPVKPVILSYLNRLSDFLFMLARYLCLKRNCNDNIWSQPK
ncbi:MAG: Cob(I)yrinic acid a,c-diamide adenosyltransferase [Bacteroidetes bacterium ADurb.Bin408]|nr:MAG: Cob(I)yrinic acid a,c-diamide adenosyltransferase [Bacteroidetes bacterium ADurb.Bin408]